MMPKRIALLLRSMPPCAMNTRRAFTIPVLIAAIG
jgi:hypothetical protein